MVVICYVLNNNIISYLCILFWPYHQNPVTYLQIHNLKFENHVYDYWKSYMILVLFFETIFLFWKNLYDEQVSYNTFCFSLYYIKSVILVINSSANKHCIVSLCFIEQIILDFPASIDSHV